MAEEVALVCNLCHYPILRDDVAMETETHHVVICLACYARCVEIEKPMPPELRRELIRLLSEMEK